MALPSERRNVPFRSLWGTDWQQPHEMLSHRQAKEGGEGFWDAEHLDGDRASRSCQQRRYCARCARERGKGVTAGLAGRAGSIWISRALAVQLQTCPPMLPPAPVTRSRRGAEPMARGCSSTLTWRGFLVALPCHWHCPRRGQGRQLQMLAAYTTRRLPSASLRRSWATSDWPAGQRKVPSGWRGKSCPEKRPAFQGRATTAFPYPCGGEGKLGA